MGISRRKFLKSLGLASAFLTTGCSKGISKSLECIASGKKKLQRPNIIPA